MLHMNEVFIFSPVTLVTMSFMSVRVYMIDTILKSLVIDLQSNMIMNEVSYYAYDQPVILPSKQI